MRVNLLLVVLLVSTCVWAAPRKPPKQPTQYENPAGVTLTRHVPGGFSPNSEIEVQVTISAADPTNITALGLSETIPNNWRFGIVRGISDQPPPVAPAAGATQTLEFAWINVPPMPYTFAYTLQIPADAGGTQTISGYVQYRQLGPENRSDVVVTELEGKDVIPPTITLLGDNPLVLPVGSNYVEPGWRATDNVDGDVSARVQVRGEVDTSRVGTYRLTYVVADAAGNQSAPVQRTIRVVAQTTRNPNTQPPRVIGGGALPYEPESVPGGNTPAPAGPKPANASATSLAAGGNAPSSTANSSTKNGSPAVSLSQQVPTAIDGGSRDVAPSNLLNNAQALAKAAEKVAKTVPTVSSPTSGNKHNNRGGNAGNNSVASNGPAPTPTAGATAPAPTSIPNTAVVSTAPPAAPGPMIGAPSPEFVPTNPGVAPSAALSRVEIVKKNLGSLTRGDWTRLGILGVLLFVVAVAALWAGRRAFAPPTPPSHGR